MALHLLARSEKFGDTYLPYQTDMLFMLAVTQAAFGHYTQAETYFDQLFSRAGLTPMAQPVMIGYLYARGRAYCQQGRLDDARQVLAQMSDLNRRHHFPAGAVLLPMLEGLLALAEHRDEAAAACLQEAARLEPDLRVSTLFGSSRLMLAHLYLSRQQPEEALAAFSPVLAECEQQDTAGLILQEGPVMVPLLRLAARQGVRATCAARMLELFGVTGVRRAIPIPDTGETLTSREVEVLELIATGATNREIADALDISRLTVKSHVTRLLRKLDVPSRTQAAARASELGVVSE
jgi:ATP/maltotriose-dependent transcriptional regulator MalT